MSNFSDVEFSDFEEIGYRLKAIRLSRGLSVNAVRENHMTHVAYDSIEDGRGSLNGLVEIAKILDVTISVDIKDSESFNTQTNLENVRNVLQEYRESNNLSRSKIATKMGVPYASVIVFESAERPRIRSFARYVEALGLNTTFSIVDKNNNDVIPSKILNKDQLQKLKKDFKHSYSKDLSKVKVKSKIGETIKGIREKQNITKAEVSRLSGIKEASVVKVESGESRISTASTVVESMGYELYAVIENTEVKADDITYHLDKMRVEMGYNLSDFSRKIGTTYRTVKIFPESKTNFANITRYADGLGISVKYKVRKKSTAE